MPNTICPDDIFNALYGICIVKFVIIIPHPIAKFNKAHIEVSEWNDTEETYNCVQSLNNFESIYRINEKYNKYLIVQKNNASTIPEGIKVYFDTKHYANIESRTNTEEAELCHEYYGENVPEYYPRVCSPLYFEDINAIMCDTSDVPTNRLKDTRGFVDPITGIYISYRELMANIGLFCNDKYCHTYYQYQMHRTLSTSPTNAPFQEPFGNGLYRPVAKYPDTYQPSR